MQNGSWDDDVEIEGMTDADLEQVMAIERGSFPAPWSPTLFKETLAFPHAHNFVIRKRVDNKVVGYANFYLIRDEVQVLNIAIDPASRKKGYATRLMKHAIALLAKQRAQDFYLEVRESNGDAMRLYQGLGFRKIGRRKRYYTETNEDAIVMHLKVKEAEWMT